jgi:NAD(P)-dependent dehydrogenase (short-subunit alcohol dehydrogenase family)
MEKVALVTGSSSGIGLETVLSLARDGYHTFASMRDVGKAGELEHAAKKENLPIEIIELDVDKEESIVSAIKKIIEKDGRLDVLVNNAGYGQFGCTEDISNAKTKFWEYYQYQFSCRKNGITRISSIYQLKVCIGRIRGMSQI